MDSDPHMLATQRRAPSNAIVGFFADAITWTSSNVVDGVRRRVALRGAVPAKEADAPKIRLPLTSPNWYWLSFIAFVAIPSFLCVVYLVFIASDQFESEARFAVRTAQLAGMSSQNDSSSSDGSNGGGHVGSTSAPLAGSAPVIADQDAYIVANYIGSRTIIDDLAGKIDIRAIFQRPEADFWAQLSANATSEDLVHYWRKMVAAYVDATSGIVIVTVRAFRPANSTALAQAILHASEKLANEFSARARTAVMHDAEAEVRRSEGLVVSALLEMREFRDAQGFIDPLSAATSTSTLLMQTMSQKIQAENDYFVAAKAMSPNAPSVTSLKTRLDALDAQIAQLQSQLTSKSPEGRTISASLAKFEELELKRMFAEKLYTMAQDALERARLKAEDQNIYIATFVSPALPQEAEYPKRANLSIIIPLAFFIFWSIFAMLTASINDHRY